MACAVLTRFCASQSPVIPTSTMEPPAPTIAATATATEAATPKPTPVAPTVTSTLTPAPSVVPPLSQAATLPVVYRLPGIDAVRVEADLVYKTTGSTDLHLDVYYPDAAPGNPQYPAVIFVHGDVLVRANVKDTVPYASWGRLVAASGIGAVSFNWRYGESVDLLDVVRTLQNQAQTLGIDGDRLCVFAFSAGVSSAVSAVIRDSPEGVRCLVAYYGDMRLPLSQLREKTSGEVLPILVAKAQRDEFVAGEPMDALVTEALGRGGEAELLVHPLSVHAFDLRNDDDISRDIIDHTLRFLHDHLDHRP